MHSEEIKAKIKLAQARPEVIKAKQKWLKQFWKEVKQGKRKTSKRPGRPAKSYEERFWEKVVKGGIDDCWIFNSTKGGGDYGMLSVPKGQEAMAHRISWILHHGPIPDDLFVLHTCDVPKCVNPNHLFLGTTQDNSNDKLQKGREIRGTKHTRKGKPAEHVKLTEAKVIEIRRLYATGKYSQQFLGEKFGVNQTNIGFIVRRVRWTHI